MKTKTSLAAIAAAFLLSAFAIDSAYAQENSSANLKMVPTQERIPRADWRINPEYIIPPIGSAPSSQAERRETSPAPVVSNSPSIKVTVISELERGKWYVQIGAYTRAEHMEEAIKRVGTTSPMAVQNVGTDTAPMFRLLLGPFSQDEGKTIMRRFKDKGYDAFLRSGS
jgi:cell division septation protein DedD